MGEPLEEGEVYRGPCGVLKDSNWLSAETLPQDRDTVLQIEAVVRRRVVKFKNETKKGYGSIRFAGKDKELGLNATHIAVLSKLFGPDTAGWFGKWVALYVDPAVSAFGKMVPAVRIRAQRVQPPGGAKSNTAALWKALGEESIVGIAKATAEEMYPGREAKSLTPAEVQALHDAVFAGSGESEPK